MMEGTTVEKFGMKNLDCAGCAAKIERSLNQVDGVKEATVDFANLMLYVKTPDIERVLDTVGRIAPSVQLIHKERGRHYSDHEEDSVDPSYHHKREQWFLGVASALFLWILFFEEWFHLQQMPFLELGVVFTAYLLAGRNVLFGAFGTIRRGTFFDENVLMVIATVGALAIHAYSEAVGVMIFYKVGEMLQELAVSRSRKSIKSLLAVRPDKAVLKTENGYKEVAPHEVKVNDEIVVKPGEKIPLDGVVLNGDSQVDTSAITGEFKPRSVHPGDTVMAGQINNTGALLVQVTKLFSDCSIAKVMELVENAAARKAQTEKFITSFAHYYTPGVVVAAFLIAMVPPLFFNGSFETWIYRALVLLVISCPCALMVSIPLGYFGGIGRASQKGILVKGSNFIDALAQLKTVVFDKTGTLTKGSFKVKETVCLNGFSKNELLEFAAAAELHSTHPIGNSIRDAYSAAGGTIKTSEVTQHSEISGEGVQATYGGKTIFVGSDTMLHREKINHDRCEFDSTVAHVAVDNHYVGYIIIGDEIKPDAKKAIEDLRLQGVDHITMLTGDNTCIAEAVSHKLQLTSFHAGLLPEDKVSVFEQISEDRSPMGKIAYVGDGINDAPVIARADVGIAMGALGSDAAIETADVVLMTDSPAKIAEAIAIARSTKKIVWQNITLAFLIKGIFIAFGAMGLATMWEAVFADMGTALLAVFNSTRILNK